jgi:hypothetical protein
VKRIVVALLVLLAAPAYADDDPELHKMRFVERGDVLTISSTPLAKLFDAKTYEQIKSGVAQTVLISIAIFPKNTRVPVTGAIVQRKVAYEPWDEVYNLSIETVLNSEAPQRRKYAEKRQADALKRLTAMEDLTVAPLSRLPFDQVFVLEITVQLNPVSKETQAEVRRWLSQGTGGGLERGGAFFGSFVSVFVNPKIADADRVLRIRSQPFFRPRP